MALEKMAVRRSEALREYYANEIIAPGLDGLARPGGLPDHLPDGK